MCRCLCLYIYVRMIFKKAQYYWLLALKSREKIQKTILVLARVYGHANLITLPSLDLSLDLWIRLPSSSSAPWLAYLFLFSIAFFLHTHDTRFKRQQHWRRISIRRVWIDASKMLDNESFQAKNLWVLRQVNEWKKKRYPNYLLTPPVFTTIVFFVFESCSLFTTSSLGLN